MKGHNIYFKGVIWKIILKLSLLLLLIYSTDMSCVLIHPWSFDDFKLERRCFTVQPLYCDITNLIIGYQLPKDI